LAGFGQIKTNIAGSLTINGQSIYAEKQIRDTIPVLIVFAESPSRITVSAPVKYMMGYLVREQNGYYDAAKKTTNINGFSASIYTPEPLMVNVKYLDGNKIDILDKIHVLMSKEIK